MSSEQTISPERKTCLAEEWVRDGRGFYAVRTCENHANGRHGFGSWSYYAKSPHLIRADAAENALKQAEADLSALRARTRELETAFDFRAHLHRQREFSELTFGPGRRTAGVVDHIRKELREIEAEPGDLREWVDVVILALDGAWRAGFDPDEIIDTLVTKQARNEARKWPGLAHDAARQGYRARSCGSLGRGVPPRADGVRKTRELSRSRTPYLIRTA